MAKLSIAQKDALRHSYALMGNHPMAGKLWTLGPGADPQTRSWFARNGYIERSDEWKLWVLTPKALKERKALEKERQALEKATHAASAVLDDFNDDEETAMKAYKPRRKTGKKVGRRSAKERQELIRKRKAKRAETRRKRAAYYKKNRAALLKRAARRRKMMKGKPVKKKDPNAVYTYK